MPEPTAAVRPFDPASIIPDGREYCWSWNGNDYYGDATCPCDALDEAVESVGREVAVIHIGYVRRTDWPVTGHASSLLESLLDDALGFTGTSGRPSIERIEVPSAHEAMEASGYTRLPGMAKGCGHLPARLGAWAIPQMQEQASSDGPDCAEGWLVGVTDEQQAALDRELSRLLSAWYRENPVSGPLNGWEWPDASVADLDRRLAAALSEWLTRTNNAPSWYTVPESVAIRRADAVLAVHVPGRIVEDDLSPWGYESWQTNPWEGAANRDAMD